MAKTTNQVPLKLSRAEVKKSEDDFERSWIEHSKLNLELAGIFYVNAILQLQEGERNYEKLETESKKYYDAYKKRASKYEVTSASFYTSMLPRLRGIEVHYEPVVRYFSASKILFVCCVETFINEVASVELNGRKLDEFDKLSILGKWLFIQDIVNFKKRITLDKNPLQDVALLISERNKLVHFKGLKKKLNPFVIPNFLEDLNLTPSKCKKNAEAVKNLILEFNYQWSGATNTGWLNIGADNFRNPCFYLSNRQYPMYLYSKKHDFFRF